MLVQADILTEGEARMQVPTLSHPPERFALTNGRVILPHAIMNGMAVIVEGSTIAGIAEAGSLGTEIEQIDVDGRYIAPGLIDIHIPGALSHTFNEGNAGAFATISETLAGRGVTSLLATLATAAIPDLVRCLEFSRERMRTPHTGAQILGVQLEGP